MEKKIEEKEIVWGIHKDYKAMNDALWEAKIPLEGECKGANNKALEKYRKAVNVIYDLFNNGLMNRGRQLRVLGLTCADLSFDSYIGDYYSPANWDINNKRIWEAFKPILLEAVAEQFKNEVK
mgnify:CR=1 FL=1